MDTIENRYWNLFFTLTEDIEYPSQAHHSAFITAIENVGHRLDIQPNQADYQEDTYGTESVDSLPPLPNLTKTAPPLPVLGEGVGG